MSRFGCIWPDGSYTGGITDSARDAGHYAKQHGGSVYEIGGPDDPEKGRAETPREKATAEEGRAQARIPPQPIPSGERRSLWD